MREIDWTRTGGKAWRVTVTEDVPASPLARWHAQLAQGMQNAHPNPAVTQAAAAAAVYNHDVSAENARQAANDGPGMYGGVLSGVLGGILPL